MTKLTHLSLRHFLLGAFIFTVGLTDAICLNRRDFSLILELGDEFCCNESIVSVLDRKIHLNSTCS